MPGMPDSPLFEPEPYSQKSLEGKSPDGLPSKPHDWASDFVPTTPLAKALWELRKKLIAAGGGVSSAEENREYIRRHRAT